VTFPHNVLPSLTVISIESASMKVQHFIGGCIQKDKKEGRKMTLNLILFTISIKKRELSIEEELHNQMVENHMEEHKARQASFLRQV